MTKQVAVIVGGWLGDEGKGKATQYYLNKYMGKSQGVLCIRSSGGTNTGATVYVREHKLDIHMLPVGAFQPGCHSYIGNAVYINMLTLMSELQQRQEIVPKEEQGDIYISKLTHVVIPNYLGLDEDRENGQHFGSTKNGVSVAASKKYSYSGVQIKDKKYEKMCEIMERKYGVKFVDPINFFENEARDWNVVIEGTQGIGLDVNHGFDYPYVSAGSFSTFGLLDGVGYALAPTEVCMVLKTYGSYFGPLRMDGDFEDDDFRKFAGEYGTTTKRPRNLAWLDLDLIRRATKLIKPTCIMLNHFDTLNWFANNGKTWKVLAGDGKHLEFDDIVIRPNHQLTTAGAMLVDTISEYAGAPVTQLGIGPKSTDIISI